MAGVHAVIAAGARSQTFTVTIASLNGGLNFGYQNGFGGSVSPTSILGGSFSSINSNPDDYDFQVTISASGLSQSSFSRIVVQDGSGNYTTYRSSDANYVNTGIGNWRWGSGSSLLWSSGDVGESKTMLIYF